ncbi:MAG TPA: hypothetical protein VGC42_14040 [Kofleriaceae bacterium]
MIRARSTACFARCARAVVVVGALAAAGVLLRGERPARACSFGLDDGPAYTVFDPDVLGEPGYQGVYYDAYVSQWGGYQPTFGDDALVSDWHIYLAGARITDADWRAVLFTATKPELAAIRARLAGRPAVIAKAYEHSSLWAAPPAMHKKLDDALGLILLARDVEPAAQWHDAWDQGGVRQPPAPGLLGVAKAGLARAQTASPPDLFLAQRYAFQAIRVLFYQQDWSALIALFEQQRPVILGPAFGLGWRARYYYAGELRHRGDEARAALELAHIHANYPLLAGAAAGDFHPNNSWADALALARTPRDKVELWRIVGVTYDGVAAIREILKIDPRSELIALLLVRELARAESKMHEVVHYGSSEPEQLRVARGMLDEIGALVRTLQRQPGVDRPWLLSLIAGHLAARRGDLATARAQLGAAMAARPTDERVLAQARSSLAIALVAHWRIDPAHEHELGALMNTAKPRQLPGQPVEQRRLDAWTEVRQALAPHYLRQGKLVDAELLADPIVDLGTRPGHRHWADVGFIQQLLARVGSPRGEFERFTASAELTMPRLLRELGIRHALDGNFAAAVKVFQDPRAESAKLEVDPFVTHIKDCRECDEQRFAASAWTHASVIGQLAQLAQVAAGTDERAAEASIQIGNALYNFGTFGNARRVLAATHQDSNDARPALRWYQRAYDLTKDRERKARAAFYAAKAERVGHWGEVIADAKPEDSPDLPLSKSWFPRLEQLSNTAYYREVLKECGTFQTWALGRH